MGPIEVRGDVDHEDRIPGVGDVIDLVAAVAIGAQQVVLARVAVRELVAAADLNHLRPALGGQVVEIDRIPLVRDIDDRVAVFLDRAGQRIACFAVVVADIGDPPSVLLLDDAVIGAARLQVVKADEARVVGFFAVAILRRRRPSPAC
jgi:hypothetical protein